MPHRILQHQKTHFPGVKEWSVQTNCGTANALSRVNNENILSSQRVSNQDRIFIAGKADPPNSVYGKANFSVFYYFSYV